MALSLPNSIANNQGMEIVNHGTNMFPVACYDVDLEKDFIPWHWHEEIEIILVTKGICTVLVKNETLIIKENEALFINNNVLHTVMDINQSACTLHSIVFHPRFIGGSFESVIWSKYLNPILTNPNLNYLHLNHSANWHKEIIETIDMTWHSCERDDIGYELTMWSGLSKLMLNMNTNEQITQEFPSEKVIRDNIRIKTMLKFIHCHYNESLTIAQIAESVSISKSECLRCFSSTIGSSPIQYLKHYRLHEAARQLKNTNKKIMDIGSMCGFSEMSYFTKSFKEFFGCRPKDYRKIK